MTIISETVKDQREYFLSGATRSYEKRLEALQKLKSAIQTNEKLIDEAMRLDLNKSSMETYMCETGMVYDEISFHIKHLAKWMKDKKVKTPLAQFPSKSFISSEPYGVVLIMSPWNYPVQLCLSPLVGAISAGNCAVVKPSAYTPKTSSVIAKIISEAFDPRFISVIEGGREQNSALLEEKFDYIFFTGSVNVGKVVMSAAAKNLTPVTLELGGKSPVIVEKSADIKLAAKRIAFGKILNAGQTCVAPDYCMIDESVEEEFIQGFKKAVNEFFPNQDMKNMPTIINQKHFDRLMGLLPDQNVILLGELDERRRFIPPTLVTNVKYDDNLMKEEIFGPILPILKFKNINEAIERIVSTPKPLALYLFTTDETVIQLVLDRCSFGGGCINDTIIHLATPYMSFGGVGNSGMGSYHGKKSFETFSHDRSIVKKSNAIDLPMRYHPYSEKKKNIIKKFMK